jgi:formylglycine-generating enzyme required for sulfatase activity
MPQLCAAPSAWVDSRKKGSLDGVNFQITGYLATAALGEPWQELKFRLCEKRVQLDKGVRWQCLRDLVAALARLEQAGLVHGDLSPGNILVNSLPVAAGPTLSVIDFDAFVAPASEPHLMLPVSAGGTYGTAGYCPPDLVRKAEAGDLTTAPYSDRHSRDMLLLEVLLAGPDFPPEAPPREWPPDKLQLRYRALLATAPPEFTDAIAHLHPPAVFSLTESQRPSATELAKALAPRPLPRANKPKPLIPPLIRPSRTVPGLGLELIEIKPGTFLMGSPASEADRQSDEGPQTQVTISKSFWMGKFQVTQGQYEAVTGTNPSSLRGNPNLPVERVSWEDAARFCAKLTQKERQAGHLTAGQCYRLPTEAEWEYACRAGSTTRFSFGDDPQYIELEEYGWYAGNSEKQTHPVGSKVPNAWGLYDLHGNVREWCLDWKGAYLGGSVADPQGPAEGSHRVSRGGSRGDLGGCRAASRHKCGIPTARNHHTGFRLVMASCQEEVAMPLELVELLPGTFLMGSPASEAGRNDDEGPRTRVRLTKEVLMAKHAVTQGQYAAVMGTNPSRFTGSANLPVERVSWHDAVAFCAKLTELERHAGRLAADQSYRLPTEAEWEYACRARMTTDSISWEASARKALGDYGWTSENSEKQTHPVGTKAPNAWGLYDMHGNVMEWCQDWKGPYLGGCAADPQGPSKGSHRVLRGGSWSAGAQSCRPASRLRAFPAYRDSATGFRVALDRNQAEMVTALELVELEPGSFLMGSPGLETSRASDEGPQTQVTISHSFSMGKYQVTQGQYVAVIGSNPSSFQGSPNLPVENVLWEEAASFCVKLTEQERQAGRLPAGHVFRLPTEAEWEYACRAGSKTRFSFGDDPNESNLGEYAWYCGCLEKQQTHPVGVRAPNSWGLYDMHGNVWEWCLDWEGPYPGGSVTDPQGPSEGDYRVLRGGDWASYAFLCRSAYRGNGGPSHLARHCGFRVVLALAQPELPNALEFVELEAGTFLMGSPLDEADRTGDEGPQTRVAISRGFSMGKHEVTQEHYAAVMGANPSSFKGIAHLPVENVSWADAASFCARLTEQERQAGRLPAGLVYRLPTEAEWEYACRAGTTTCFGFGDNLQGNGLEDYGWYSGNSGRQTHPVGAKAPNAWGLYDMHGNVGEWCLDWSGTYPGDSLADPQGPITAPIRGIRGGGAWNGANSCRSAYRSYNFPTSRSNRVGFRVLLAAEHEEGTAATVPGQPVLSGQSVETVYPGALELVKVEPGAFMMGSPQTEPDRYSDEGPQA